MLNNEVTSGNITSLQLPEDIMLNNEVTSGNITSLQLPEDIMLNNEVTSGNIPSLQLAEDIMLNNEVISGNITSLQGAADLQESHLVQVLFRYAFSLGQPDFQEHLCAGYGEGDISRFSSLCQSRVNHE
jgi:hypothetical protein